MKRIVRRLARPTALPIVFAAFMTACADARPVEVGEFVLQASVVGTTVSTLIVTVTAADIPTPLVFNIHQQNGTATGTLRVPPGDARLITVQAFDNLGQLTHEGSKAIDVVPGQNPAVSIAVISRAGQVPITATLGPVSISLTALPSPIIVHETAHLTATITAPNGDAVPGPVEWATTNPTVATVDESGKVTIVGPGSVQIVATYAGVAAAAQTTVAPVQEALQYATWDGQPFSAWLSVENGVAVFHHRSPYDPNYVNDVPIINYLSPGGPGSVAWQARAQAAEAGGYEFLHYRVTNGCSPAAPCLDHSAFFIGFQGWNGERLVASIADIGGRLGFSVRPGT